MKSRREAVKRDRVQKRGITRLGTREGRVAIGVIGLDSPGGDRGLSGT